MRSKKHLLFSALIISVLFFCGQLPVNPDNPDNSSCSITLISQSSGISDTAVSDTVNATVMAIMKYTYPSYFDSVNIKFLYPDKNLSGTMSVDTSITIASFIMGHFDSSIVYLKLKNPGRNKLIVTSYISNKKTLIDSATIIVQENNVSSINLPPVVKDDSYSVAADEVLNVNAANGVLVNDADPEGSTLSAVLIDTVAAVNGSLIFNPDGSFSFTPTATAVSPVSFSYTAKDANGNTSVKASVSIEIKPANSLPVITGISPLSLLEGTDSLRIITATDPDNTTPVLSVTDTLIPSWIGISQALPNIISLTISPDHSVATGSQAGSFTIHFTATDNKASVKDSMVIAVNNVIQKGSVDDSYSISADQTLSVTAANGVLANDTNHGSGTMTAIVKDSVPQGSGTLVFNNDGSFSFSPLSNVSTIVSFSYVAIYASGDTSSPAKVSITINRINKPPVISGNQALTLSEESDSTRQITAMDSDGSTPQLKITDATLPAWITCTALSQNVISVKTTPVISTVTTGLSLTYTLHFSASDDSVTVKDSMQITVQNTDIIHANDDIYNAVEGTVLTIARAEGVLANDTDVSGSSITAKLKDTIPAEKGNLVFNSNGSFVFTPASYVNGTVTFTYVVTNLSGISSLPVKVSIVIRAVNNAPAVTGNMVLNINEGADSARQIIATDPDGTTPKITVTDATLPGWLTYTNPAVNTVSLSIKPDYSVVASGASAAFTVHFSVTDDSATVKDSLQIIVRNVNQKPIVTVNSPAAVDTVISGSKVTFDISASDPDGSVSKVNIYKNGTFLSSKTTAPYTFTTEELPYGTHSYVFAAIDNSGDTTRSSATTIKSSNWLVVSETATSYPGTFDRNGNPVMYEYHQYNHTMIIFKFLSGTWQEAYKMTLPDADTLKYGDPYSIDVVFKPDNQPAVLITGSDHGFPDINYSFIVKQRNSDGTWTNVCNEIDSTLDFQTYFEPQLNVLSTGTFMLCLNLGSGGYYAFGELYIQNGSSWKELDSPADFACQLYNNNSNLYSISGNFGHESNYKVHKFNGTTWTPIGPGDGTVNSYDNLNNMCFNSSGTPYALSHLNDGNKYSIYSLGSSSEWEKVWPLVSTPDDTATEFCLGAKNDQVYSAFIHSNTGLSDTLFFKKLTGNTLTGAYSSTGFVYDIQGMYSAYLSMSFTDNNLPILMWRTSSSDNSTINLNVAYLKVP